MIELLQQSIDALNKARRQIVNAKVTPHAFVTETIADLHKAVNKLKEQSNCKNCNCSAESAIELRRAHQSEREGWRYADELEQDRKRLDDLCIKQLHVIGLLKDQLVVKNSGIIKEDKDTQEQCDLFDEYLEEYHDGRTKHSLGAYGYDEQEWEAFQSGWNASKKHFGVFWI